MSEKQKIIEKMIQMQKQFIARERNSGVKQEEYFVPQTGDILDGYRETFDELAAQVLSLIHI
mgnify:FL=1